MNNEFNYTYSAPSEQERREIDNIRRQYQPMSKKEAGLLRLRQLDNRTRNIPLIISLCVGSLGALIFGFGLSLILVWNMLALGIVIMILGAPFIALAYPLHNLFLSKYKEKHRDEILRISDTLLNEKATD